MSGNRGVDSDTYPTSLNGRVLTNRRVVTVKMDSQPVQFWPIAKECAANQDANIY
jgi:hypothetical protein